MRQRIMRKLSKTLKLRKFEIVRIYSNGKKVTEKIATFDATFDPENYERIMKATYGEFLTYIRVREIKTNNKPIISYSI